MACHAVISFTLAPSPVSASACPASTPSKPEARRRASAELNCILLFLVGGPSQLDTWDMKPDAPEEIRGPFRPIETNVPGLWVSEIFPKMAQMMDKVALVRSVNHNAAAVHDTGHQMMQTGRLFSGGIEHPHYGSALAKLKGPNGDTPRRTCSCLVRSVRPGGTCLMGRVRATLGRPLTRSS